MQLDLKVYDGNENGFTTCGIIYLQVFATCDAVTKSIQQILVIVCR